MDHDAGDESTRGALDRRSIGVGAVGGVFAYLIGFTITYLLKGRAVSESLSLPFDLGPDVPTWIVVGWLFHGMHQVNLVATATGAGRTRRELVAVSSFGFWESWLILVPAVVITLVGVRTALGTTDLQSGALTGASMAAGYLIAVVAGTVLFTYTVSAGGLSVSVAPDLISGVVLAGVLFPAVFGTVGGLLGSRLLNK